MSYQAVKGWPSWRGEATLSGGSWAAAPYGRANMLTDDIAEVARTTNAVLASTVVDVALPVERPVRALAFVNHNASFSGIFRLSLYEDAAQSVLLKQTAWEFFWPEVYAAEELYFWDPRFWTGQYAPAEIANEIPLRPVWLDTWYWVRSIKIEIDDTTNADGYVQIGALDVAQGYQYTINFELGSQFGYRFRTREVEATGGAKAFDLLPKPRVFRGAIDYALHDEAMSLDFESLRQTDLVTPFLWLPHPDEPRHWLRSAMWARHLDPGFFAYGLADTNRVPIHLEQVL